MRIACALLLLAVPAASPEQEDRGKILLTIFLRHDQSKTLPEIQAQLARTGFNEVLPAKGRGGRFLVRDDGHWPGGYVAAAR